MKKVIAVFSLLLLSLYSYGQPRGLNNDSLSVFTEKLDAYLQSAFQAFKFNGVALVAKQGKLLLHKAYGWRDLTTKSKNDTSTRFPILSITKSFTAIVLLQLQEQKKLSLSDPLDKYLPHYPEGNKIRLEHLLTHTSGIYNYTDNIDENDSAIVCHPVDRQLVLDQFISKPLAFKPGKGFSYNNSAYYLAGMVIEKVTGKPYEQVVREQIFTPLDMKHSGFDYLNLPVETKAVGYQYFNDLQQKPYPFYDSTVGYAAGSIYSTTNDMLKWVQAIGKENLLSPSSWKLALKPKARNYGYGFQLGSYQGKQFIKHSGGYPGFTSAFIYYPAEDIILILFRNTGNYGQDLWPMTMGLSNIVFDLPYDLWQLRKEIKLADTILLQKTGTFGDDKIRVMFLIKEGRLHCLLPDGNQLPMLAENEDVYYFENFNTQFRFYKDSNGQIEKVVIHEHGIDNELRKVNNTKSHR